MEFLPDGGHAVYPRMEDHEQTTRRNHTKAKASGACRVKSDRTLVRLALSSSSRTQSRSHRGRRSGGRGRRVTRSRQRAATLLSSAKIGELALKTVFRGAHQAGLQGTKR